MKEYDLVVIGSGPAGEKAAVKAAFFGYRVAIIEKERSLGGAGVNTGTLPSKTLKETALYYSGKYDKGLYGIDRELKHGASIDEFMYRKQIVCTSMNQEIANNLKRHKVDIYHGIATLEDTHTVRVTGTKELLLRGRFIIIATGSYPYQPENIPFDGNRVHDSDSILTIGEFPKTLCIVGAGVIGCEYATIFAAMGAQVFLINNKNTILSFLDTEISQALVREMQTDGIDILFETEVKDVRVPSNQTDAIDVVLSNDSILHVDMFLYAAGRSGNTRTLNLEKLGIKTGKRETIPVNACYQTNISSIYAVGDVVGFPALASTSMDQGRVAVSHMFQIKDHDRIAKIFPYGIYTIPEVSMVGLTEEAAKSQKISYEVGIANFSFMPRGKIMGIKTGFLKLVFEKDSLVILGVHCIGPLATELIHFGLSLVENKKNLNQVISTIFNYPTLHDLYKYASYNGLGKIPQHTQHNIAQEK
ncbi:MAG: Si-specific NAD(P)(+) transhydrogenase [Oligoflexales bacterium]